MRGFRTRKRSFGEGGACVVVFLVLELLHAACGGGGVRGWAVVLVSERVKRKARA